MNNKQIAIKFEIVARRALNITHKDGMAGIISIDFVMQKKGAFTIICVLLSPYYLNATNEERKTLDLIIDRYKILYDCDTETYFEMLDRATNELRIFFDHLGVQDAES